MSVRDALNNYFMLPDMGDFYYDYPDQEYYMDTMDRVLNPLTPHNPITAYRFYQEDPPMNVGYDPEHMVYMFNVALGEDKSLGQPYNQQSVRDLIVDDGDTVEIPYNRFIPGDLDSAQYMQETSDKYWSDLVASGYIPVREDEVPMIGLRFACIDTKELPHFIPIGKTSEVIRDGWRPWPYEDDIVSYDKAYADDRYVVSRYQCFMDDAEVIPPPGVEQVNSTSNRPTTNTDSEQTKNFNNRDDSAVYKNSKFYNYARPSDSVKVMKYKDKWVQYFDSDGYRYVCVQNGANNYSKNQVADAGVARDIVANMIANAEEMRVMINGCTISRSGDQPVSMLKSDSSVTVENTAKRFLESVFDDCTAFTSSGFNEKGQDLHGRLVSVVYVKVNGQWINLNKMVKADTNCTLTNTYANNKLLTNEREADYMVKIFKPESYNVELQAYCDSIIESTLKFDDREKVQAEIIGELNKEKNAYLKPTNWDGLKNWTVIIGDVVLMIPPTSIHTITQSKAQRRPLLRARGTMAKGATKAQKTLNLDLYFYGDAGINGIEYKTKTGMLKDKNEITYWMNGLRALIAQFKVAPFLPIENEFINNVMNIDAVSMLDMSLDTVPNFPALVKVTLQLAEFEYRIYMPEIPKYEKASQNIKNVNYFAKQINYPLFRYFYQRLIRNGEDLKGVKFLDAKYISNTFGNKTCLIPMDFGDSSVKFYLPNEAQLKQLKEIKISRLQKAGMMPNLSTKDVDFATDVSKIYDAINGAEEAKAAIENLNAKLNEAPYTFFLFYEHGKYIVKKLGISGYYTTPNIMPDETIPTFYKEDADKDRYFGNDNTYATVAKKRNRKWYCQNCDNTKEFDNLDDYVNHIISEHYPEKKEELQKLLSDLNYVEEIQEDGMSTEWLTEYVNEQVNTALETYKTTLDSLKNANGQPLCSGAEIQDNYIMENHKGLYNNIIEALERQAYKPYGSAIIINTAVPYITDEELTKLKTEATSRTNTNASADEIFKERKLAVPIYVAIPTETDARQLGVAVEDDDGSVVRNEIYFSIAQGIDTDFIAFLKEVATHGDVKGNATANDMKQSIDWITKDTLKFDEFKLNSPLIANTISLSFSNIFSQITLQAVNGYAPQYMGGSDIGIQVNAITLDESVAAAFDQLPDMAATYAREYGIVLPAWPLKIESQLTKLVGITDVMIDSVSVSTIPNFPGAYQISITMVSVDRSLRNRESMQKTDLQKTVTNISIEGAARRRYWEYEAINNVLSEAELYPDLELPTIQELADNGFEFVRYSNKDRKFPDPDFYFTYSHLLVPQIIREAVIHMFDEGELAGAFEMGSEYGHTKGSIFKHIGEYERDFDLEKNWNKSIEEVYDDPDKAAEARIVRDFMYDSDEDRNQLWTITPNIKVSLMERRYLSHISDEKKKEYKQQSNNSWADFKQVDDGTKSPTENKDQGTETAANRNKTDYIAKQEAAVQDQIDKVYNEIFSQPVGIGSVGSLRKIISAMKSGTSAVSLDNSLIDALLEAAADTQTGSTVYAGEIFKDKKWQHPEHGVIGTVVVNGKNYDFNTPNQAMENLTTSDYIPLFDPNETYWDEVSDLAQEATDDTEDTKQVVKAMNKSDKDRLNEIIAKANKGDDIACLDLLQKYGVSFGIYAFKTYSEKELKDITGQLYPLNKNNQAKFNTEPETQEEPIKLDFSLSDKIPAFMGGDRTYENFIKSNLRGETWDCQKCSKVKGVNYENIVRHLAEEHHPERKAEYEQFIKNVQQGTKYLEQQERSKNLPETDATKDLNERYLLDPYYRFASIEEIEYYKRQCCADNAFAKQAFERIVAFWMYVLAKRHILPSYTYDILRSVLDKPELRRKVLETINDLKKEQKKEPTKTNAGYVVNTDEKPPGTSPLHNEDYNQIGESYVKQFQSNCTAIDNGKVFLGVLTALNHGSRELMTALMERKYDVLDACSQNALVGQREPVQDRSFVYIMNALLMNTAGRGGISSADISAGNIMSAAGMEMQRAARKNVAAAADDPTMYLVHSFYDMVSHDCRGRMLRAFPTFYFAMIDEGRAYGVWKLHDNFYNTNAVSSLTITKSRKMSTDVAEILMSNFYQTFTTEDEDINTNYTVNYTDVFRSMWLPALRGYAIEQEEKRKNAQPLERFKLRPGARVHIRIGYGADAMALPIAFNGCVAEVEVGDYVQLICQSDGSEISQPILIDEKAAYMQDYDKFIGSIGYSGATPKTIITSLLECHGGVANTAFHSKNWDVITDNFGMTTNPFGLVHFGSRDQVYGCIDMPKDNTVEKAASALLLGGAAVTAIIATGGTAAPLVVAGLGAASAALGIGAGATYMSAQAQTIQFGEGFKEISQNILEVAPIGTGNRYGESGMPEKNDKLPTLSFELFGKTIWDILHICKSTDPSYITDVAPFDMRSTIFFGRPHDYYAYTYKKIDGVWCEKRKPYQQYHIYDSFCDIIGNQIKIEAGSVKTCAVGMYSVQGAFGAKVQKKTAPQWIDKDIYSEFQKTYYFDTQLFGMPSRPLGVASDVWNNLIGNWVLQSNEILPDWLNFNNANKNEGENEHNHRSMATIMTRDSLKTTIGEMYQGQLVVIGDPTVKPFDRLILTDTYHEIRGQVQVRDIVQNFSFETGYTTAITPDLIATTVEEEEQEICASFALQKLGTTGAIMYTMLSNAENITPENIEAVKNQREAEDIKKANESTNSLHNENNSWNLGGNIAAGLSPFLANMFGPYSLLIAPACWMVGATGNSLANYFESRRCLTLFPLTKYGKVMVGGIDGHAGLVWGSPSYGEENPVDTFVAQHLGKDSILGNFVKSIGFKNIYDAANSGNKQLMDNVITQEKLRRGALSATNDSHLNEFRKTLIDPTIKRLELKDEVSVNTAKTLYGVYGTTEASINQNQNFLQMRCVMNHKPLRPFIDLKFFRIIGNGTNTDNIDKTRLKNMYLLDPPSTVYNSVNVIFGDKDGDSAIINVPYLHTDALAVLTDIVDKTLQKLSGTEQTRDAFKWYQDNAESMLVLKSALQVNSTSLSCTGFGFILEASNSKTAQAMNAAIESIQESYAENAKKGKGMIEEIFYKKDNSTNRTVANVLVKMPAEAK